MDRYSNEASVYVEKYHKMMTFIDLLKHSRDLIEHSGLSDGVLRKLADLYEQIVSGDKDATRNKLLDMIRNNPDYTFEDMSTQLASWFNQHKAEAARRVGLSIKTILSVSAADGITADQTAMEGVGTEQPQYVKPVHTKASADAYSGLYKDKPEVASGDTQVRLERHWKTDPKGCVSRAVDDYLKRHTDLFTYSIQKGTGYEVVKRITSDHLQYSLIMDQFKKRITQKFVSGMTDDKTKTFRTDIDPVGYLYSLILFEAACFSLSLKCLWNMEKGQSAYQVLSSFMECQGTGL